MDRQNETMEIDLMGLLGYLRKRLWILIAAAVLFGLGGYVKSAYMTTPLYKASTRMYVLNRTYDDVVVSGDFQSSNYMLNDYMGLITGQNVTKEVIERLGLKNMSPGGLSSKISVSSPEGTRILQITVTDPNPIQAAELANAVREVASEQIKEIMEADAVQLVYKADIPGGPSSPNVKRETTMACIIGVVLAAVVLTAIYLLDDTIRTEEDVEKWLGLSVIGVIPVSTELNNSSAKGKPATRPAPAARPAAAPQNNKQ